MAIRSVSDVLAAHDEGRTHVQRFLKGSLVNLVNAQWQDWAYAPGQPGYDARVGASGRFNPFVAARNDAVWFPDVAPGQTRHLSEVVLRTAAGNTGQGYLDAVVYDLLGVYPLIDGDSVDVQTFTNDDPLPRYADGAGVFPVLVNHVAPVVTNAPGTYTYVGSDGVERSASFGVTLTGPGRVCSSGYNTTLTGGDLSMPMTGGAGVRAVTSLRFTTAPGGLFSLYLYKPMMTLTNLGDEGITAVRPATVKSAFLQHGWHAPRVYDGAHLGMFVKGSGVARDVASIFGHFEFIWG